MPEVPRIVVLTGAGVSQESGLATFRDLGGIWSRVRLEEVATPEAFAADPARVHAFYSARRAQLIEPGVQPNAAHRALARLDAAWPADFLLVTQNVDDLHERAGSTRMVQMHGALNRVRCTACGAVTPWREQLDMRTPCPSCSRTTLRPDIVWFGEMPMQMGRIAEALAGCTLFVSIGTSGQVHPAAGFVAEVRDHAHTVELNLEQSAGSMLFDEVAQGPATKSVPAFVDRLLATL